MHPSPKPHETCTRLRTKQITRGTFNPTTGAIATTSVETRTQPCGTPLFADAERNTGICSGCHDGWAVPGNRLATDREARLWYLDNFFA